VTHAELLPLEVSLARAAEIGGKVGASAGAIGDAAADALGTTLEAAGKGLQSLFPATLSGEDSNSAALVAWRGAERKASLGRRAVHDAIEAVEDVI
jgi:hypothetical protein